MSGAATSEVEITNISQHGFWLLLDGRELFVPFERGVPVVQARHRRSDPPR